MESVLPTVKIKNPAERGGFIIINATDFDPEKHELFKEKPAAEEKEGGEASTGKGATAAGGHGKAG